MQDEGTEGFERTTSEGGCHCGAIRLRASGLPMSVIYCHCQDCRRSSGAPVSLFAGYRAAQVEMEQGTPKGYASSPGITRSFCVECGTPLSYEDRRLEGEIYLHVGIFDEPQGFEPEVHGWISRKLPWFDLHDDLPRYEESSVPR